jgi:hypothetical protein
MLLTGLGLTTTTSTTGTGLLALGCLSEWQAATLNERPIASLFIKLKDRIGEILITLFVFYQPNNRFVSKNRRKYPPDPQF